MKAKFLFAALLLAFGTVKAQDTVTSAPKQQDPVVIMGNMPDMSQLPELLRDLGVNLQMLTDSVNWDNFERDMEKWGEEMEEWGRKMERWGGQYEGRYKGRNTINLLPKDGKNVIVISGKNGFGKTTFLMSLVWCLYGRQMENVDEMYKKVIEESGGYTKYITKTLNNQARIENETKFSVSVVFQDVKIPEISCNEVRITRTYDDITSNDKVEVLIDGYPNELIRELTTEGKQDGEEIFIRDFILPIEVAKFFFFDAEKIVSIAENNSPEQRKLLSKAYTEVLGIKKYEDLKDQLESLQDDYRKKSATKEEQKEFNQIETDIKNKQIEIENNENKIIKLQEEKIEKKGQSDEIQVRLIQDGSIITPEQLANLKSEEEA